MINPQEEYNRLHDHCQAIARERDWLQSENDRLTDELNLAHEAMRRAFPENQQTESDKWRNIAGNLYDEIRVRGGECLYQHEDKTKDCVNDYELADTQ
jgi:hypothetical protein